MNILGTQTQSIFLKQIQSHKLHHEFTVATGATIKVGMPVKMNAVGEIVPFADDDNKNLLIGYSIHNAAAGEFCTVGMVAFAIVWAYSSAAITTIRPVKLKGVNGTYTDYMNYENIAISGEDALAHAWALDAASGANEKIRVAIF